MIPGVRAPAVSENCSLSEHFFGEDNCSDREQLIDGARQWAEKTPDELSGAVSYTHLTLPTNREV